VTSNSPGRSACGFTLVEVLAAVLVLGLLYTVLASSAMRGLRAEGIDRRRADAAMVADRALSEIELEIARGELPKDGLFEEEQEPYVVRLDVQPVDVLAMVPRSALEDVALPDPRAPSVLHDERGQSRVRRISVVVAWDEAGEESSVERTTYALDTAAIAQFFPSEAGQEGAEGGTEDPFEQLRKDAPPELQQMMPGGGGSPGNSLRGRKR
jgi:prepilin-type N-terminal cleavage/methylation domain-containing protein